MNRYPRLWTVSTNRGTSASSPSVTRSRRTAAFRLCSKSTNVPLGQSRAAEIFAADDLARPLEQRRQDPERLILQRDPDAALAQLSRPQVHLEGAEPDDLSGAGAGSVSMLSIIESIVS